MTHLLFACPQMIHFVLEEIANMDIPTHPRGLLYYSLHGYPRSYSWCPAGYYNLNGYSRSPLWSLVQYGHSPRCNKPTRTVTKAGYSLLLSKYKTKTTQKFLFLFFTRCTLDLKKTAAIENCMF